MRILHDVNIWSFWQRGWLCIPTMIGCVSSQSEMMFQHNVAVEATQRFPELVSMYARMCGSGKHECVVYKTTRLLGSENVTLSYHDLRLPTTADDHGMIVVPVGELKSGRPNESWRALSTWECVERSLKHLANRVRRSVIGTIYIPTLVVDDVIDEDDVIEIIEECIGDHNDFVILTSSKYTMTSLYDKKVDTINKKLTTSSKYDKTQQTSSDITTTKHVNNTSSIADEFDVVIPKRTH